MDAKRQAKEAKHILKSILPASGFEQALVRSNEQVITGAINQG
jgi:hypothetical protein